MTRRSCLVLIGARCEASKVAFSPSSSSMQFYRRAAQFARKFQLWPELCYWSMALNHSTTSRRGVHSSCPVSQPAGSQTNPALLLDNYLSGGRSMHNSHSHCFFPRAATTDSLNRTHGRRYRLISWWCDVLGMLAVGTMWWREQCTPCNYIS